ncbi:hypothetical protein AUC68_08710 [Methyloceanibacter methanicus]|uniref:Uncharacterized protein n=1 Tax=Methyloceanibacter methanicus TaxID=1774968 RepID=A0A1E3W012_9HYPH|nr:CFI-box-CTERM domain-containing protein [Methyloceanibacter methanicus]ODR98496.1 hypothetical protein AUC68_08710 [Methyloceanibacter methanicus]
MLKQTRRRALGLLIGTIAGARLFASPLPALAQDDAPEDDAPKDDGPDDDAPEDDSPNEESPSEPDCYDTKDFGRWTAQASDISAGVIQNEVPAVDPRTCDLLLSIEVGSDFAARIFVEGSAEGTPLPDALLRNPESRFMATAYGGATAVNTPLCGNCTDIYDNTVGIVLPLATAPLLRDEDSMDLVLHFAGADDECRFTLDCATMRQALDWATARRDALATERDNKQCVSAESCFITTACCEVLGLGDDCFELRTLRRYRDQVLAKRPGGGAEIARYYELAPALLARLRANATDPDRVLLGIYARYVLPAALAARFGLDRLAYRLYRRMLTALSHASCGPSFRA